MKSYLYKAIILIPMLVSNPGLASDGPPPAHFYSQYNFDWNGIPLGRLALSIEETADTYKVHLIVASAGVVNLFTHHISDTVATGKRTGTLYNPEFYESYYKTKKKPRHIKLEFDSKGAVTTEINEPPEDRNDRPEISHTLKDGSYDPLSGFLMLLTGVKELKAFDAKRLYTVKVSNCNEDRLFIAGKWRNASGCILSRIPLAGLTKKEKKEYDQGEPPLKLYLSSEGPKIPLQVKMPILLGHVRGTLVKECAQWKDCEIPTDAK